MKKKLALLFMFFLMSTLSCGFLTDECEIFGVIIEPVQKIPDINDDYDWAYEPVDTLNKNILFKITTEYDCEAWMERTFSMILFRPTACYATSKGLDFQNDIDTTSFSLSLNKPFFYEDEEVFENTNLYDLQTIRDQIELVEFDGDYPVYVIRFKDLFYQKALFQSGNTSFSFSCYTDDGIFLTNSVQVFLSTN